VQECSAKKEGSERRSHTRWSGRLHQIIRIKWPFACNDFYTGFYCFTVDFWLAVRICMSLAHLWDRSHVLVKSFRSHIFKYRYYWKEVRERFLTPKNVWERCSHTFPPHYNPGHVTSTIRRDNWLGFKGLWLVLRIRAYGQGMGQFLSWGVQCLELGFSPQFT